MFEQMYSIHGSIRGKSLPLVYSLLPNKDEKAYEELFKIIKQHVKRKPNYLSIDFEKAAENSFGVTYPECEIFGCFFSFQTMYLETYLCKFVWSIMSYISFAYIS